MSDTQHSLQTYISDMLAVEQHVREPFEAQLKDEGLAQYPSAQTLMRRLSDTSNRHIDALEGLLSAEGGHEAHPMKAAVTQTLGFFASTIDKVRKTGVAKALRDDYTALSLCTVSYSMLLTTANAYGETQVAGLAQQHMRDYAQILMQISDVMPEIVVQDLRDAGLQADVSAIEESRSQVEQTWRSSAAAEHAGSTTGEIVNGTGTARTLRSV